MKNAIRLLSVFCTLVLSSAAAAQTGGSLWAMGNNRSGQLGDGTTYDRPSPVMVIPSGVQSAAAGWDDSLNKGQSHSLIVKTDGSLWAMGLNNVGQFGNGGADTAIHASPVEISHTGAQSVAAGYWHSLIVATNGSLWSMGWNQSGQLGDGSSNNQWSPVRVMAPGEVQSVAAGGKPYDPTSGSHSLIVKTDGSLWAMGRNNSGQLGDGTKTDRNRPVRTMPDGVKAAAAGGQGYNFVGGPFSQVVKMDGSLWAMGNNSYGQFGNGTTTSSTIPVPIPISGVQSVAAGGGHSLIVRTDGSLWAVGNNASGQLGDGTTTTRLNAVQILPNGVRSVAAGISHSLIVKTDGSLWAMGDNFYGQLGDGSKINRNRPVKIRDSGVLSASAGGWHSLFIVDDNTGPTDTTAPTVTVNQAAGQADPAEVLPINYTVVFSEPVTGFTKDDVSLATTGVEGVLTVEVTGSGTTYNIAVGGIYAPALVSAWVNAGVAQDAAGNLNKDSTSADSEITYNEPDTYTFKSHPLDQLGVVGGSVSFDVAAAGLLMPILQWQRLPAGTGNWITLANSINYSGVSAPTLTVTGISSSMNGDQFRCLITNSPISVISNVATLTVTNTQYPNLSPHQPPEWSSPIIVATISGTTSDAATIFDNQEILIDWAVINSSNTGIESRFDFMLLVDGVERSNWHLDKLDSHVYAAVHDWSIGILAAGNHTIEIVTDSKGAIAESNEVDNSYLKRVTVLSRSSSQAPTITTQPLSQTIATGHNARFSVMANGAPPPSYQWQVSTNSGGTWTDLPDAGYYSGVTTNALTITAAILGMNGYQFRCLVSNAVQGNVTSGSAVLAVNTVDVTQPTVTIYRATDQPTPTGVSPINFTVVFSEAVTGFTEADVNLSGSAGATTKVVTGAAANYTLSVSGMTASGTVIATIPAGVAQDVAGNLNLASGGTDNRVDYNKNGSKTISLSGSLAFGDVALNTKATKNLIIINTGDTTLNVTAITYPNGFSGAWAGTIAPGNSQSVTVTFSPGAALEYSGTVIVTADQTGGTATILASGTGVGLLLPSIVMQPTDLLCEIGANATFGIAASGGPGLAYQWLLNGQIATGQTNATFVPFKVDGYHNGYTFACVVTNSSGSITSRTATLTVGSLPIITTQPKSQGFVVGQQASLAVTARKATAYQWFKEGVPVAGASGSLLAFPALSPTEAGIYDVLVTGTGAGLLSIPVVVGIVPAAGNRTAGSVSTRPAWQNIQHPNGSTYDQFLLSGSAGTFTADPGQIARLSYLDENDSIVQVEMSGAGATTVILSEAIGPIVPVLYTQTGIQYMKGKATIILAGSDDTTHITIYSVGTFTNPGVTRLDVNYSGWASVAATGIISSTGLLGGIHQGNVAYSAERGITGIYAPNVIRVGGLAVVHSIEASGSAQPYLYFGLGGTAGVKIAGSALAQLNGDSITVGGLSQVQMGAGQDSCGRPAPARVIQSTLVTDDGSDVTAAVVRYP